MSSIGCSGEVLAWFSSFISEYRQQVALNGNCELKSGFPQASNFLFYINDIVKRIGGSI